MARGDQLARQWKIIQLLLASRQGRSVSRIATALACHPRTVYRDLEALQAAGFPLYTQTDEGKNKWLIMDNARRDLPLPLSLAELMALYFSRRMLQAFGDHLFSEPLASLFEKVKTTLPKQYHHYLNQFADIIQFAPIPKSTAKRSRKFLTVIQQALAEQRIIEIEYYAPSRQSRSRRKVEPYRLWFSGRAHYLIGYCRLRNDVRLFAVDRIRSLTLCDAGFKSPPVTKIDALMADSFGVFRGDPVVVGIVFSPRVADYIKETEWHDSQRITLQADGGVLLEMTVAGIEEVKYWILKWGKDAKVAYPPELREAVREEAREILAQG